MADKETPRARARGRERERERERGGGESGREGGGEGGAGAGTASALRHRRLSMFAGVSTPTYLCKSFNLTPPYRAYPERDRISKPIRIHCLATVGNAARPAAAIRSRFPCPDATAERCLYRRKVLRHACVRGAFQLAAAGNTRGNGCTFDSTARARVVYDAVGEERRSAFYCNVLPRLSTRQETGRCPWLASILTRFVGRYRPETDA